MDVLQDQNHRQWLAIAETYDVPSYVYDSDVPEKQAYADVPDTLFADPVYRRFPIDSAANTWMSAAYFNESKHEIKQADLREYIRDEITKAAELYGIDKDVKSAFETRIAVPVNPEDVDDNYAYVVKSAGGDTVQRRYFIPDETGLEKACRYFTHNRHKYPSDMRVKIATGIVRRAAELGVDDIPAMINKEAGYAVPYRPTLLNELLERSRLTKDAESSAILAEMVEVVGFSAAGELIKGAEDLVSLLADIDALNGMTKCYGRELLSPQEVVYSMTVKDAAAMADDSVVLDKIAFSVTKLAALEPETFTDVLGADFAEAVSDGNGGLDSRKIAAVLPTLPRPDRMVLERHIVSLCSD